MNKPKVSNEQILDWVEHGDPDRDAGEDDRVKIVVTAIGSRLIDEQNRIKNQISELHHDRSVAKDALQTFKRIEHPEISAEAIGLLGPLFIETGIADGTSGLNKQKEAYKQLKEKVAKVIQLKPDSPMVGKVTSFFTNEVNHYNKRNYHRSIDNPIGIEVVRGVGMKILDPEQFFSNIGDIANIGEQTEPYIKQVVVALGQPLEEVDFASDLDR